MEPKELENIVNETLINEVKKIIMESNEKGKYVIKQDNEPIEYFDDEFKGKEELKKYIKSHPSKKFILEKDTDGKQDLFDKLDEMVDELEENNNEINKTENMKTEKQPCNECGDKKSKTLRLNETQMINLIEKMVNETTVGLSAVKRSHEVGGKETKSHMADVEKKIKDYLKFDNNDNPEFPKPIGKGDKVSFPATDEETEQIEDERGGTALNLDYEQEPSENFKKRLKMALEGDPTMGNSHEWANTIKSDVGKDALKNAERKNKKEENPPMYNKDAQPVTNEKKSVNENIIDEDIEKMKKILNYNKKTQ